MPHAHAAAASHERHGRHAGGAARVAGAQPGEIQPPAHPAAKTLLREVRRLHQTRDAGCHRNVTIVSGCYVSSPSYAYVCGLAESNLNAYAERHRRYGLRFFTRELAGLQEIERKQHTTAGTGWTKLIMILSVLESPRVQHAFWIDCDAVITNLEVPLEPLIPRGGAHLTFAGDHNCFINAGVLMLRSSKYVRELLVDSWTMSNAPRGPGPTGWAGGDQEAMVHIWTGLQPRCSHNLTTCCARSDIIPEARRRLDIRPRPEMNMWFADYRPGDFIIHLAGEGAETKAAVMFAFTLGAPLGVLGSENRFCLDGLRRDKCQWTEDWSCPGQPTGRRGVAEVNPHALGFHCCCQPWRRPPPTFRAPRTFCDADDDGASSWHSLAATTGESEEDNDAAGGRAPWARASKGKNARA